MRGYRGFVWLLAAALAVMAVACLPSPEAPTPTPNREEAQQRPTATPPTWQEPFVPITLANVDQIQYLGRLDSPRTNPGSVFAHAFSTDGTRLIGMNQVQVVGWDLISGETVFSTSRSESQRVFYSPDKTEVYVLDGSGIVKVYNGENGDYQTEFTAHRDYANQSIYDPQTGLLAVNSNQGEVRVWDTLERTALSSFSTNSALMTSLVFSPNNTQIAIGNSDGTIQVWNWREREKVADLLTGDPPQGVVQLAFSADGEQIAAGTDEDIRVLSLADQKINHILLTGRGGSVDVLTYTPNGNYIVNSGTAEAMTVWNAQTGELAAALPGVGSEPTAAAFSPDGELMLTAVFQGDVMIWNLTGIGEAGIGQAPLDVTTNIIDVAWSPDGRTLALFETSGSIQIWGIPEPVEATAEPITEESTD
jgi:WD40 repeat protein